MGMKYTPQFTESSKSDYDKLDGSQKKQVLKSLVKLEETGLNIHSMNSK
jgi:mRNA-degrading endonuclease RelE of RelBE toxin-antitoxin system